MFKCLGPCLLVLSLAGGLALTLVAQTAPPETSPVATAVPTPLSAAVTPTPSPEPLPEFVSLPVVTAKAIPTILNRRLTIYQSNALGMLGDQIAVLETTDSRVGTAALLDPGWLGDQAAWNLVASVGGGRGARWIVVDIRGAQDANILQWQRLLDSQSKTGSAYFKAFTRYPGAGFSAEQEYHQGNLFRSVKYDKSGNVQSEYRYVTDDSSTTISEYTEYRRVNDRLEEMVLRGPDGSLHQSIAFSYTLDGRVHQIAKHFPDGHEERFLFRYGLDGLNESWMDGPEDGLRWSYDGQGRLVRSEEWRAGAKISQIITTWAAAKGTLMASRESTDFINKTMVLEVFDEQGRLVQMDENHNSEPYRRTSQVWNPDGTLGEVNVITLGRAESTTWDYAKGIKVAERYSKEGVPVRVTTYSGKNQVDELYLDGKPILRVYYHNNTRYKEEELHDGKITRTRNIK